MNEELREKCRLTNEEIDAIWRRDSRNWGEHAANAQLDKAEPLIRQDERARLAYIEPWVFIRWRKLVKRQALKATVEKEGQV